MKIEQTQIRKLRLTNVPGLDPIDLFVEDTGAASGKITVTCFGASWTAYWGNTGMPSVAAFVAQADVGYLVNCLSCCLPARLYDPEAVKAQALREVLRERRRLLIGHEEARQRFDAIEELTMEDDPWRQPKVLAQLLGDEWYLGCLPEKPNPAYEHLARIVTAVKAALSMLHQPEPQECANAVS